MRSQSMRSVRGGLFPAVVGPCKRYAMAPARGHRSWPCIRGTTHY